MNGADNKSKKFYGKYGDVGQIEALSEQNPEVKDVFLQCEVPSDEPFRLNYGFDFDEIALLAKFFRKHQDDLPDGLEKFERTVEDSVYNNLSLEQIRDFYEK